jgi:hypothetical protein
MEIFRRALSWIFQPASPAPAASPAAPAPAPRDHERQQLRATARVIAMAALSDGDQASAELSEARAASQKVPILGALRDSAFDALLKEAFAKLASEGEGASMAFVAGILENDESRARAFGLAAAVVLADRELREAEGAFLDRLRVSLSIPEEEAQQAIREVSERLSIPLSEVASPAEG